MSFASRYPLLVPIQREARRRFMTVLSVYSHQFRLSNQLHRIGLCPIYNEAFQLMREINVPRDPDALRETIRRAEQLAPLMIRRARDMAEVRALIDNAINMQCTQRN